MSESTDTLPSLLAKLFAWRTISDDETLLSAPQEVQIAHRDASIMLSNLREGDQDPWLGKQIFCIVRKSTRYIVYLTPELDVCWWWLVRVNEQVVNTVQARVNALKHESAFLLAHKRWRNDATQRQAAIDIRSLIGEAMAMALNSGTQEDCDKVLAEAQRQIAIIKDQQARPVFAGWFIGVVALGAIVAAVFYEFGERWMVAKDLLFVRMWLEAGLSGTFGALISALTRTRALQLDPAAGHRGLFIEAVARALIGAGAGLLVFFALKAGILQAALSADPEVERGIRLFVCIAAGASERILPSLIGKAENVIEGGNGNDDTKTSGSDAGQETPQKPTAEQAVG